MNYKKGFILLETIVVVCVLCVILVILFSAYSGLLINVHKKSLYDNTEYIYKTNTIRAYLEDNTSLADDIIGSDISVLCSDALASSDINQCNDASLDGHELFNSLGVKGIFLTKWDTEDLDTSGLEATTQKYIKYLDDKKLGDEVYRIIVMFSSSEDLDNEEYQYASLRFGSRENQHTDDDEQLPDVPLDSEEPSGPSTPGGSGGGGNIFTVTFDPNGGSVDTTSIKVGLGKRYGELPMPRRSGYGFVGWFTSKTGGSMVKSNSYLRQSGNQTLYARWTSANVVQKIRNQAKSSSPNFANAATTDEGVYSMSDDYGTSYYFRGAVTNNYVKIGRAHV